MSGISVKNLRFSYRRKIVLDNITFDVNSGEILAILGPNGSGKTTLLKCLNRILKPAGCVYVSNLDLSKLKEKDIAKIFGYVPQVHLPPFPYRVVDIVVSGRTPYRGFSSPSENDYKIAQEILSEFGLEELKDRPYTQLSGGELKLVLIARALAQKPDILLLDEPLSHLDLKNKVIVLKVIKNLAKRGITVIFTEHDPNVVTAIADKVLLLKNGKILKIGSVKKVLTKENIIDCYNVDVEVFKINGLNCIIPVI